MKRHQVAGGGWVTGGEVMWRWLWFIPGRLGRLFRVHPENPEMLRYAGSISGDESEWRREEEILADVEWWNPDE